MSIYRAGIFVLILDRKRTLLRLLVYVYIEVDGRSWILKYSGWCESGWRAICSRTKSVVNKKFLTFLCSIWRHQQYCWIRIRIRIYSKVFEIQQKSAKNGGLLTWFVDFFASFLFLCSVYPAQVAHLMRAVYSFECGVKAGGQPAAATARQLAESLSTLPLPEDYALQVIQQV